MKCNIPMIYFDQIEAVIRIVLDVKYKIKRLIWMRAGLTKKNKIIIEVYSKDAVLASREIKNNKNCVKKYMNPCSDALNSIVEEIADKVNKHETVKI